MLEGFPSSHPPSWNSPKLVSPSDTVEERDKGRSQAQPSPNGLLSLRGRSHTASKVEQTAPSLYISLDFLHQAEDEAVASSAAAAAVGSTTRGRLGPGQQKGTNHLNHHWSSSQAFWDSPDLDSPFGSEQEWRRSLATKADPIFKTPQRSSSREPPGSARLPLNGLEVRSHRLSNISSPHFDSFSSSPSSSIGSKVESHSLERASPSRDRSSSTSRVPLHSQQQQQIYHLTPWSTDSGSPLRQPIEYSDANNYPSDQGTSHPVNRNQNLSMSSHQSPSNTSTAILNSSSSPGKNRPVMASSPTHLATMPEEAFNDPYSAFRTMDASNGFRNSARHRSISSAAALQQQFPDKIAVQRGNSADTFNRSISLWKGEFGGMSPGTYSQAAFQQQQQQQQQQRNSPAFSSQSSIQRDRERRSDYIASSFDAFSEEEDIRELGVGGSESRRHSIAANPGSTTRIGQRRAIGFEVNRPLPGSTTSRTNSIGRSNAMPLSTAGSGLFGRGNSTISEDDLAADLHTLQFNFEDLASSRQQQEERRRNIVTRTPSNQAATSGVHAASVPSGFGSQGMADDGQLHSNNRMSRLPISAGFRDDETNTSWSDMIPSPPTTNSGFSNTDPSSDHHLPIHSKGEEASSPYVEDRKTMLSATAKAFHGGSQPSFAGIAASSAGPSLPPPPPPPSQQTSGQYASTLFISRKSSQDRNSDLHSSPPMNQNQFKPFDRQTGSSGGGGTTLQSANTSTLSDLAIASLVTLGPLAPASGGPSDGPSNLQELGKGVPLQMLPRSTTLYIVEFKEGRTDLYFRQQQGPNEEIRKGDLVIVEADRGKDLGTVINDSITVDQVQGFLAHQAELAQNNTTSGNNTNNGNNSNGGGGGGSGDAPHPAAVPLSRLTRSINPKRLFSKAGPADTTLLHSKAQDEERALTLCTTKVNQRGLPMTVVAAEMQWDRRKLTFYYTATQRVDFRDLVKELFRLYKTRIWMCHLSHPSGTGIAT